MNTTSKFLPAAKKFGHEFSQNNTPVPPNAGKKYRKAGHGPAFAGRLMRRNLWLVFYN
jgi:hypothetical protein